MPGFNGTGPQGNGPLTGKGRGFCIRPIWDRGAFFPFPRRRGYRLFNFWPFSPGQGRGRGGGRCWR